MFTYMKEEKVSEGILPIDDCEPIPTLYVIGNGFDVAHGIKSRYSDFRDFEMSRNNVRFVTLMDIFFSTETEFWSDIETALGQYDEDSIIDFCNPEEEFDIDHPTRSEAAYSDSPDYIFQPLLTDLKDDFREWVDNIDISGIGRIMTLNKDAKYLTFNYTDNLESIYGIHQENILHIHGARGTGEEYIVGHSNYRDEGKPYDDDDIYFKQETRAKIIGWMNKEYKDSESIVSHNEDFFSSLNDVKQVIVIGHSLNEVDLPYFRRIVQETGPDILWKFSFYGDEDVVKIQKFIADEGLRNVKIVHFDDFRFK